MEWSATVTPSAVINHQPALLAGGWGDLVTTLSIYPHTHTTTHVFYPLQFLYSKKLQK